ncbi:acetyl-CoA carboxylase biotin carboxyl carrier protein subunit [soil metagenome]
MKLQAEIGSEKYEINVRRDGRRVVANVDGREYDLEVSEPEPNIYLFKHEGQIFEAFVSPTALGEVDVSVHNNHFDIKLIDPKRLRGAGSDTAAAEGIAEIRSAMPGKIVRILADVDETVEKGQGIIVVEAMKMQNELKSPKNGIVREIRVGVDSTVSSGDVLATIE